MVPAPVRLARPTPATAMRFVSRASASMISEGDPDDLPNLIACDPAISIDIHDFYEQARCVATWTAATLLREVFGTALGQSGPGAQVGVPPIQAAAVGRLHSIAAEDREITNFEK